ncbi:MAG: DUF370 domain-containing protein [Clostridia bacterium]|nr:DUF370 domain-containing protein [Clostridia bacterium]
MYLHIGNGETVRIRDLVAFFDFDSMTVASISRKYLSDAEKKKKIVDCTGGEIPRSVLLVREKNKDGYRILFSLLSTAALRARLESGADES